MQIKELEPLKLLFLSWERLAMLQCTVKYVDLIILREFTRKSVFRKKILEDKCE